MENNNGYGNESKVETIPEADCHKDTDNSEKLQMETQFYQKSAAVMSHVKAGANWFYWIAGLSVVNTLIILLGGDRSFVFGLGTTMFLDVVASQIGGIFSYLAIGFDVVITGLFVLFGIFANKVYKWAFITGMVLYALDGIVYFVVFKDYLSIVFHIFALYCIFKGYKAIATLDSIYKSTKYNVESI